MSLFFLGVLRLDEETLASYEVTSKPYRTSDISGELTRIALDYGYGIQIGESNINKPPKWEEDPIGTTIRRMQEKLGGTTLPFHLLSAPDCNVAHEIFLEFPMNRDTPENINFLHFLKRIWHLPGVSGGAFLVWDSTLRPEAITEMNFTFDLLIAYFRRREAGFFAMSKSPELYYVEK